MNLVLLNLESSAYTFYPEMQEKSAKWYNGEHSVWKEVIFNAIKSNEIKNNINPNVIVALFEKIYLGISFLGITKLQGIEIEELQEDFYSLYDLLKK